MHYWKEKTVTSRLQSAISNEIVTLVDFKEYIKWGSDNSEDNTMMAALTAASKQAELSTRRTLYKATWRTFLECFPSCFSFNIHPVTTSTIVVKYFDTNNVEQTLSNTEYFIKDNGPDDWAQIYFDGTMPSLYDRYEPIYIEFNAGYEPGELPEGIKIGILRFATDYFENRQNEQAGLGQLMYGSLQSWFPYKML